MNSKPGVRIAVFSALYLGFTSMLLAAQAGLSIPVEWSADGEFTARIENSIRIVEMQDNVRVTQGKLAIAGDQAIFEYTADSNDLIRVTVHGTPVQYQQEREGSDEVVTGSSNTIILYEDPLTTNTLVEMQGDATIQTADSTTSCVDLVYDTVLNIIPSSTAPCTGSLSSPAN